MSDHPVVTGSRRPLRRPLRRVLTALGAPLVLTTLAACQDTAETTSPPVAPAPTARLEKAGVDAWLDGMLPPTLDRLDIAGAGVAVACAVLVLLALVGTAWFAVPFRLLAPSVSY